jgi:putative endonuclease
MDEKSYLYIVTNEEQTTFYIGVTSNLIKTIYDYKKKLKNNSIISTNFAKLVYYDGFSDISQAILREKELKSYSKKRKLALINKFNPTWEDLYSQIDG